MGKTYLALGSNLGDREDNLLRAIAQIRNSYRILSISSIYETTPVGYREQPSFLNMVLLIDSGKSTPHDLLSFVKKVELKMGRKRSFHWGPRLIDIDILYMDGIEVDSGDLTVPHRELLNRKFFLVPLSEITDHIIIKNRRLNLEKRIQNIDEDKGSVYLYKSKENLRYD
jgi:2-amino-4-hydroxy-6-hydroxymethyldihydropteridine diphosphokinase